MSETLEDYVLSLKVEKLTIVRMDKFHLSIITLDPLLPPTQVDFDWRLMAGGPEGRFMRSSEQ